MLAPSPDKGDVCPNERPLMRDWAKIVDANARIWVAVRMDNGMVDGAGRNSLYDKQVSIIAKVGKGSFTDKD